MSREREAGGYRRQLSIDEAPLQLPSYQQGGGGMAWGAGQPMGEEEGDDCGMMEEEEEEEDGMDERGTEQYPSERQGRYAVNPGWGTAS